MIKNTLNRKKAIEKKIGFHDFSEKSLTKRFRKTIFQPKNKKTHTTQFFFGNEEHSIIFNSCPNQKKIAEKIMWLYIKNERCIFSLSLSPPAAFLKQVFRLCEL